MSGVKNKLILEGPDGVGKSTLAGSLAQIDGSAIYEHGKDIENTMLAWTERLIRPTDRNIIWSRSFLSERIYADVYKREPRITEKEQAVLIELAKNLGYRIMICLPRSYKSFMDRLNARGDNAAVMENIFTIVQQYENLVVKYNLEVIRI